MLILDHIAIAATDLAKGTADVEAALGVSLQTGGKHALFGTHNMLLNLGDIYLEVIAKDPDAPATGRPTWFNLDHFDGPTRPANWICRTDRFDKASAATGSPIKLTRDALSWELTVPDDGSLPFEGAYPSLLKWGVGITPPSESLPDQGCRLLSWTVFHPDASQIAPMVALDDARVIFEIGAPGFKAVIATPSGSVTLG